MKNKYLHFRFTFESPLIHNYRYYDISDSDLCVWNLDDFNLIHHYPRLCDAYSFNIKPLKSQKILLSENDNLNVFDLASGKIIETIKLKDFIEYLETQPESGLIVCLISGKAKNQKQIHKWISQENNKIKYLGYDKIILDQSNDDQEFLLKVFRSGLIFLHLKNTDTIYQINAFDKSVRKNIVSKNMQNLFELEYTKYFGFIERGKVQIFNYNTGNYPCLLQCQGEEFLFVLQISDHEIITSSNLGVKLWNIQLGDTPTLYKKSSDLQIQTLSIYQEKLIGLSSKFRKILIWNIKTFELIKMSQLYKQQIQKVIKLKNNYLCLVLKIFDETEQRLSFHNKLQLLDCETDTIINHKTVKKAGFQILTDSFIIINQQTIMFICESQFKSYLSTWRPFDLNKQNITKIKISKSDHTKLYSFDRILKYNIPRRLQKTSEYNVFGRSQIKQKIIVTTCKLKKLNQFQIQGYFEDIQLFSQTKLILRRVDRIQIFYLSTSIEKIEEIQISLAYLRVLNGYIFTINSTGDSILYNQSFDLIMKAQEQNDQIIIKMEPVDSNRFIVVYQNQVIQLWDIANQTVIKKRIQTYLTDICMSDTKDTIYLAKSSRIQISSFGQIFEQLIK